VTTIIYLRVHSETGRLMRPGTLATVSDLKAEELIARGIARKHELPGPEETKKEA